MLAVGLCALAPSKGLAQPTEPNANDDSTPEDAPSSDRSVFDGEKSKQERAEEHFARGVELHDNGDYRAAYIEFSTAYELAPIYHLLYNLGQESVELKEYVEAHKNFVQYLKEGGDNIGADRRAAVERKISRMKKYLATLDFEVSVEGAEIAIDGIVVGISPLDESVQISVGRRKIVVTKEEHAVWERVLDVAGGDEKLVEAQLISLATVVTNQSESSNTGFWISATATGLFLAGTGAAVVLTRNAKEDYESELNTIGAATPRDKVLAIDDARKSYKRMALYTDIGIGLTIVSGITTLILSVGDDEKKSGESEKAASLQVFVGPTNVGVSGSF